MGESEFLQWSIVQRSFQELSQYGASGFESNQELSPLYLYFLWGIRNLAALTSENLPHVGVLYLSLLRGISDSLLVLSFQLYTSSYPLAFLLGLLLILLPEYAAYGGSLGDMGLALTLMHMAMAMLLFVMRTRRVGWAALSIFFAWMAVQIHFPCFWVAITLMGILFFMDITNLTYRKLLARCTVIIFTIGFLHLPYLFFPYEHWNENTQSTQESLLHFFSFFSLSGSLQFFQMATHFFSTLEFFFSKESWTWLSLVLLVSSLFRSIVYQDKLAFLFFCAWGGSTLIYSGETSITPLPWFYVVVPFFLFLLSSLHTMPRLWQGSLTLLSLCGLLFYCPELYEKRRHFRTMPEYDMFCKIAYEIVDKGLIIKAVDGVESLYRVAPKNIGSMVAYLGGSLDSTAREILVVREDGSFFLLEETAPGFPQF
jgi:hypothetical protein